MRQCVGELRLLEAYVPHTPYALMKISTTDAAMYMGTQAMGCICATYFYALLKTSAKDAAMHMGAQAVQGIGTA